MRLALVQCNPVVGALRSNAEMLAAQIGEAGAGGVDLVVTPEQAVAGYPARDLINQEGFVIAARDAVLEIARRMPARLTAVIGTPWRAQPEAPDDSFDPQARTTNSLVVLRDGAIIARYDKRLLPTYDVFDEDRYFRPGDRAVVIDVAGVRVGLSICEDLWRADDVELSGRMHERRYQNHPDPVDALVEAGAQLIVNPSASPFVLGKGMRQRTIVSRHIERHDVAIAAVNQTGGNDDLIFDGHSVVMVPDPDTGARVVCAGAGFQEQMVRCELPGNPSEWSTHNEIVDPLRSASEMSLLWRALVLGVRDYAHKTGFSRALLGISGGIDSAVTCAIGARALGGENVLGVLLPSRYSSDHSVSDALKLAESLSIRSVTIPIASAHDTMGEILNPAFGQLGWEQLGGLTDENLQSRLRGVITMALSNHGGGLLLTTGNKSELAVGYCTLYGDMNGGLAVLSDVTKVQVYRLARWLNENHHEAGFASPPIPTTTITKPPSAELRPDQIDQDSLPEYEVLDEIVERYVERQEHPHRIAEETGFDRELVATIVRLIDLNEYKRKQMPIGLKVSSIAFGRGRRRPLAQGYRPERDE